MTGHGRRQHRPAQSKKEGSKCPLGRVIYHKKQKAEHASPKGEAERCGRCRFWHPVE